MLDLTDRIVLVTGAAGNLGLAVARAFHGSGARLVLVDRAPDRLPLLFPELTGTSDHWLATSVDLSDASVVQRMVDQAVERFGRIDVLANTVGGYRAGTTVEDTPLETWDFVLNLNARTAFIVSHAVVPVMREQGSGKIIHVASRAALAGRARTAAQSASKSALLRLTESMAAELKGAGINVNCVLPGTIDTPQNREAMPKADHSRWVTPEAIADVILFLASDAARAIVGAAIPVYGQS
jgi:NAD(P)-dependent dehydrogenase (short-subunit alcohol dehydrogenase family)